jgi:hypothetical protein
MRGGDCAESGCPAGLAGAGPPGNAADVEPVMAVQIAMIERNAGRLSRSMREKSERSRRCECMCMRVDDGDTDAGTSMSLGLLLSQASVSPVTAFFRKTRQRMQNPLQSMSVTRMLSLAACFDETKMPVNLQKFYFFRSVMKEGRREDAPSGRKPPGPLRSIRRRGGIKCRRRRLIVEILPAYP